MGKIVEAAGKWSLLFWLLFWSPLCRSRSQSCNSSFLIALSGVAGLNCGGGDKTPLLVTSGLDSWSPTSRPPHRRFTPAIGTLGTVCNIITTPLPSSSSLFRSTLYVFYYFYHTYFFHSLPEFFFFFLIQNYNLCQTNFINYNYLTYNFVNK